MSHAARNYFFLGTFAPFFLASESPIAIACFLLLTLFPAFPDFNFPRFRLCSASRTVDWALRPYFLGIFASHDRFAFEVPVGELRVRLDFGPHVATTKIWLGVTTETRRPFHAAIQKALVGASHKRKRCSGP